MVIAPSLLEEIDEKKEIITKNPDYFLKRSNMIQNTLRRAANIHSFWMEYPEVRRAMLINSKGDPLSSSRLKSKIGIERINSAWNYLSREALASDGLEYINPGNILDTLKTVEPDVNDGGFRNARVTMGLAGYIPPNPVKVPEMVDKFCNDLNGSELHPVEAAAFAHMEIAAIQPGYDGNKRTGRLFQDAILYDNDLPPAFIPAGERQVYIDLLEMAMNAYRQMDFTRQRPFCDYVGGKVNSALDYIIDDLNISRRNWNSRKKPIFCKS
jgi:hypothetical protein